MRVEELNPEMWIESDKELFSSIPNGSLSLHGTSSSRDNSIKTEGLRVEKGSYHGVWVTPITYHDDDAFGPIGRALADVLQRTREAAAYTKSDPTIILFITPNVYIPKGASAYYPGDIDPERYIDSFSFTRSETDSNLREAIQGVRESVVKNRELILQKVSQFGIPTPGSTWD